MKFLISGYTNKIDLIELDNNFNLISKIEKNINSSSFITIADYIFCYDRENNPYVYMLEKEKLEIVDKIKVNINNITHLVYSKKNDILYGCSYSGGTFFGISIKNNRFEKVIEVVREETKDVLSRCHCVLLNKDEDTLVVVNIATDKLNFYKLTNNSILYDQSILLPKGCGPRHAIFSKSEKYLYVITEYSNEIIIVDVVNKKIMSKTSTLIRNDITSYGATLFINDNSLYASNRGEETIAKFKILKDESISYENSFSVYGKHSRHMIMTLDKKYIVSCNKNTNQVCFIDKDTFELIYKYDFDNPSCVLQIK